VENQFRAPDIREQTKYVDDGKRKNIDVEMVSVKKVIFMLARVLTLENRIFLLEDHAF